jgi:DnaJ-like protein
MTIFDRIADHKIREAINEGQFDDLPNQGRPIDLEPYFSRPADLRATYALLESAGCAPEEVERLKTIARLDRELAAADDESRRASLRKAIHAERLALQLALEQAKRR